VTTAEVTFAADSATWTVRRNDSTTTRTIAARGPSLPIVSSSHALIEQAVLQARATGRSEVEFALVPPGAQAAASMKLTGVDGERAELAFPRVRST
jgi:hypothetical protein